MNQGPKSALITSRREADSQVSAVTAQQSRTMPFGDDLGSALHGRGDALLTAATEASTSGCGITAALKRGRCRTAPNGFTGWLNTPAHPSLGSTPTWSAGGSEECDARPHAT